MDPGSTLRPNLTPPSLLSSSKNDHILSNHPASQPLHSSLRSAYSLPWFAVLNLAQRLSSTTVSVAA